MYEKMMLTVGQLNLMIKDLFNQVPMFADIFVKGEISNFKHHTSGHMYMSLKDETGTIRAVMFKSSAMGLKFMPENGLKVIARGRISVYERDGQYQLYINSLEKDGKGDLNAAFEALKKKLEAEGLFSAENKKSIPEYPLHIGVITAATGAAVRDIINVLKRRAPYADITLYPALVQGEGAAKSICEAIEYFNKKDFADVLIVGRGGGSIEDLWAFNEEIVARAIFKSHIPVISAVGHETDFTIADFVADLRAPTPSAAAELAAKDYETIKESIASSNLRLLGYVRRMIENYRLRLKLFSERTVFKNPALAINEKRIYLDTVFKSLENAAENILDKKRHALSLKASALDALSPLNTLKRGYMTVKNSSGNVIKDVKDVSIGDKLLIQAYNGQISAIVENTEKNI